MGLILHYFSRYIASVFRLEDYPDNEPFLDDSSFVSEKGATRKDRALLAGSYRSTELSGVDPMADSRFMGSDGSKRQRGRSINTIIEEDDTSEDGL